ncbi:hypothetical protein [Microbacterium ulmi]|uniref:PH domain-containing protein n=1 Tax=Microbacterium ulmi TaxID=179095 RepID=A0A7Y2M2W3_9MICO|nr:hypothetical protein [Microbacterium ulmi]NII70949.1 hypothetical protein [Microbacterium ulmi]NNH05317.1 hypothetical protein [Microbacterium ulmi]
MSREGALLLIIGVTLVLIGLGVWGWRRRTRRDAAPLAPFGDLPVEATVRATFDGFYVATTKHGEPLERVNAPGLGFRSRAIVTVADMGVVLDLTGQDRIVLTTDRLADVALSTVAIDRVVEKGGLVRLTWRALTGDLVDTYLRPQDASARSLADAVRPLLSTPTGSDA